MASSKMKWGIIGCANIAKKNARAIALAESAQLVAVASRDLGRCKKWAETFACESMNNLTCYGSYDDLLQDPNVEAVYMPLPTKMHREWVMKAAAAKKHVLVEKPAGVDANDLKEMIECCRSNNVMFMDGVMFMHHERLQRMMFEMRGDPANIWGPVGRVSACFTFNADADFIAPGGNIRTSPDGDPLGCLGDLGLYCIRYGLFAFNWATPVSCRAVHVRRNAAGVPIDVSAEVYWSRTGLGSADPEPTLAFHCSFLHSLQQRVEVTGNKRRLTCDDFVVSDAENATFTIHRDLGGLSDLATRISEVSTQINAKQPFVQEANMFNNFALCANSMNNNESSSSFSLMDNDGTIAYEPSDPLFWSEVSMQTQLVIDAILASDSQGGATVNISQLATNTRPAKLSAITWNIAAINNNPFEYWITHDDAAYNKLMEDVSEFINNPADKDVPIHQVFTDEMFNELCEDMTKSGWSGVDEVKSRWINEYRDRKIISEFIKDGTIGKKRLASMPDRFTNTINLADGTTALRPTVINCYEGDLSSTDKWWRAWRHFMFEQEVTVKGKGGVIETKPIKNMLSKIKKSKYPAISEEEEAISVPLQAMAGAVFDAILVHMMNTLAPNNWQLLRADMCEKLNKKKNDRTLEILETTYGDVDVQFLQEVAGAFIEKAANRKIMNLFDVLYPEDLDSDRDQNSLILLKKNMFTNVTELTNEVAQAGQSKGDLFVIKADHVDGTKYLFASFHGDTNGLLTIPVVTAVHDYANSKHADRKLVFGLDANTYEKFDGGKNQDVTGFAQYYTERGLNSCYGPTPDPKNYTTFHARTYLQPQLNKAIKYSEKDVKGDKNPKDFILFDKNDFSVLRTTKDNTGDQKYVEGMVFPTLAFPSDHGITATLLG